MELAYYLFIILYACSSIALSFAAANLVSLAVSGCRGEGWCAGADNGAKQKGTSGGEWKLQKRLKVVGFKSLKKRVEAIPSEPALVYEYMGETEPVVAVDESLGGNLGKAGEAFDDRKGLVSAEERIEFPGMEVSESCSTDDQLLLAVEVGGMEVSGVQKEDDCFGVDGSVVNEGLICERVVEEEMVCEEVGCYPIEGFDKETISRNDSDELPIWMNWLSGNGCKEDDVVGKELESCDFDQKEEVGSAGYGDTIEELSEQEVDCCPVEDFDKETIPGNDSDELAIWMNWLSRNDCKEDDVVGKELESCDFDQKEEVGSMGYGDTIEELFEQEVGCCPIEGFDKETISGNDLDKLPIWINWLSGNDCKEDDVVGKKLESCDFDKMEEVGSAGYGDTIEELSGQEVGCCPIEGFDQETISGNDLDTLPIWMNWLSGNDCKEDDVVGMELESCDHKEEDGVEKELGSCDHREDVVVEKELESCDHKEDVVVEKELEELLNVLTKIKELLNVVLPSEREEVSKELSEQDEGTERTEPKDDDNSIDVGLLGGQNGIDDDQHVHHMILESVETDLKEGAQDGYVDQVDDQDEEIRFLLSKEEVLNKDEEMRIGDECKGEMDISDGEEWEGIERSELDRDFAKAVNFVECSNKGGRLNKLGSDVIMQFYGLQKVAMEGPCYEPPPMALKLSARAKWNAWRKLGSMNPEEAMENYINLLLDKVPEWMGPSVEGTIRSEDGAFSSKDANVGITQTVPLTCVDENKLGVEPVIGAGDLTGNSSSVNMDVE